jgi:hypothetical protein
MHKSATKCNETLSKWCKNKHGASKIIDTFETYQWFTGGIEIDRGSLQRLRSPMRKFVGLRLFREGKKKGVEGGDRGGYIAGGGVGRGLGFWTRAAMDGGGGSRARGGHLLEVEDY